MRKNPEKNADLEEPASLIGRDSELWALHDAFGEAARGLYTGAAKRGAARY
jgi:hypothetical protein